MASLTGPLTLHAAGCEGAFDERRLGKPADPPPSAGGAQAGRPADRDAATTDAGGLAGGPAPVAGSDAPSRDAGGGDVAPTDCEPNPDPSQTDCPERCPERCDGEDDDCDGQTDEHLSCDDGDECELDHASGVINDGECLILACDAGYRDCDADPENGCEVSPTDPNHCGGCEQVCELLNALATCDDGECVAAACEPLYDDCDGNPEDCETQVTSLESCTGCGVACDDLVNASATCALGSCEVAACALGFGDCNDESDDGCEQALATTAHCGGCMTGCDLAGSIDDCSTGVCLAASCEPDWDECDGDLADGCESLSSAEHCGGCGKRCDATLPNATGGTCAATDCTLACTLGLGDCDDDAQTGCETVLDSVQHCGACDRACRADHAVLECSDGDCAFVRCEPGYGDCNDDIPLDGCETSLDANDRCGSCSIDCAATPATPECSGGVCSAVACPTGMADCDQMNLSCEVDLRTSLDHCGACNSPCLVTAPEPHTTDLACVARACEVTCEPGYDDCNGDYRDGCETSLATLSDCGTCDIGCTIANATPTCATQSCLVQQCATDWDDCNGDDTSCETPLDTTQNCGGCNVSCARPNALTACAGTPGNHTCTITGCGSSNYGDCDGNPANGCEVDKRSAVQDCGACDNDCGALPNVDAPRCSSGQCTFGCDPGFGNCTTAPGCETPLNTNVDCGGCMTACTRPGGTASCASGSCQLTGCNGGYDDCNDDPDDGCEALTSLAHCGACDTPCSIINGTGTCSTGSCAVASCGSGWADCDGAVDDGCERNVLPPGSGGLGPCLPDASCVEGTYQGRAYYACPTARSWSEARNRCQLQLLGDLVHLDDSGENGFVRSLAGTANVWIGATDATVEGTWRWINDGSQFWLGGSGGSPSAYAAWNGGEPNNAGDEDCVELYSSGLWNDVACSATRGFVCEVQADLCPDDDLKANPGQCGCGNLDNDGDGDGTADCNDLCPADPDKVTPGACDCGTPDAHSDSDPVPDCDDGCPTDGTKTAAGLCGCGVPDTNSDGDGQPDCDDGCPFDDTRTVAPCGFPYVPTNFDPATVAFDTAPSSTLDCGTSVTINTSDPITITGWCGAAPIPVVKPQADGGPDVVVIPLQAMTVPATTSIRITGGRPLIFAVQGDASLAGTLDARGLGATPGAGGDGAPCASAGNGGNGSNGGGGESGGGGGGGGGLATLGAAGGTGNQFPGSVAGGGGGAAGGSASASPLRGGCRGGKGGNANNTGGAGGGGGGALQLTVSGTLTVAAGAVLSVSGGGGRAGVTDEDGGGGGGAGGMLLLEASELSVGSAWLTANGGGGASGAETDSPSSRPGADGFANSGSQAAGGGADWGAGDGGAGAAQQGAAVVGGSAFAKYVGWGFGSGGGGGGGSVGFIRLRGAAACSVSASFSPASPSMSCP